MKRKRSAAAVPGQPQALGTAQPSRKRPKLASPWDPFPLANGGDSETQHEQPVLSIYYPRVISLRAYILELLPISSKSRRRKVASIAKDWHNGSVNNRDHNREAKNQNKNRKKDLANINRRRQRISLGGGVVVTDTERIQELGRLLDSTLVGVLKPLDSATNHSRQKDLAAYTQSQFRCSTLACTDVGATSSQSEIVDFAIFSLFKRAQGTPHRPPHILCHGFVRSGSRRLPNQEQGGFAGIPGISPQYPNKNVSLLKTYPWTDVLGLLGKNCEEIMLHLLLDCGLFLQVDRDKNTYYQLSGVSLLELTPIDKHPSKGSLLNSKVRDATTRGAPPSPGGIVIVRRRIFYARPTLTSKGKVPFGLKHAHVLNRYPKSDDINHTVHVMKYIFPRQFGLHNVFTSTNDPKESVQPFKDYTFREVDIDQRASSNPSKIPKRLRGELVRLVQNLQKRHRRCAYAELIRYYCPLQRREHPLVEPGTTAIIERVEAPSAAVADPEMVPSERPATQLGANTIQSTTNLENSSPKKVNNGSSKLCMTMYATPTSAVSAFCRAVLLKLVPNDMYGSGEDGIRNREIIMQHIDTFIKLRRFESISLHEVVQGLKVICVEWLKPPREGGGGSEPLKLSATDFQKRTEIYLEFIYYIFDSLLISLISANFYVTESGVHRNRIFYFRHDVWKKLTEPSLAELKSTIFREMKGMNSQKLLTSNALGYSHLRLLPKSTGARPITSLSRRPATKNSSTGRVELRSSINSLLGPVFNVLTYEKMQNPEQMGSAMKSVGDIFPRLHVFKEKILQGQPAKAPHFYFVKLDVQACFDTIPQSRLLHLVDRLVSHEDYRSMKFVQYSTNRPMNASGVKGNVTRRFISKATSFTDFTTIYDMITSRPGKKDSVFVDTGTQKRQEREAILELLERHVRGNTVKIGKKFYRQTNGIPQGSVLSALLCNFFYGEHEREKLGFLNCDEALLMRLVDDYLLITTRKDLAQRFVEIMLDGDAEYGISVSSEKTLTNFEIAVDGLKISHQLPSNASPPRNSPYHFPYCGVLINTCTLDVSKDTSLNQTNGVQMRDRLNVDSSKAPGQAFMRKSLLTFALVNNKMFLDTKHNSGPTLLRSVYHSFVDCGMRLYAHLHTLSRRQRRRSSLAAQTALLIRTIYTIIDYAAKDISTSSVAKNHVRWLGAMAFGHVFRRKQTQFGEAVRWLDGVARASKPNFDREAGMLWRVVRDARGAEG